MPDPAPDPSKDQARETPAEKPRALSVEERLGRARPLPPREQMVIDDLDEEEQEAFWEAINA